MKFKEYLQKEYVTSFDAGSGISMNFSGGYTAVEWKEPVRGVHQILVLDPQKIKIVE